MNMTAPAKKGALLCASVLAVCVLFSPVRVTETGSEVQLESHIDVKSIHPVPNRKPILEPGTFKVMSLNLSGLFSFEAQKSAEPSTIHPYGYKPLSAEQSALYAHIFEKQALGNFDGANLVIKSVRDKRLMGHVLFQRYMHPSYVSTPKELKKWMSKYADHPGAPKLYKLAVAKGAAKLQKPKTSRMLAQIKEPTIYSAKRYATTKGRTGEEQQAVRTLSRKIRALVRTGNPKQAQEYLETSEARNFIDDVEYDKLRAAIAEGYLYLQDFDAAYEQAAKAAKRSGKYVPESAWVTGLTLWQQERYADAASSFEKAGASQYASGWLSSAGYYWASRSYESAGNKKKSKEVLAKAAKHSRTFYGLMAAHSLGIVPDFHWDAPEYGDDHEELILSLDAGQRAYTLVAAGQYDLAEAELLRLDYKNNRGLSLAVLAYASHVGLPDLAMRLGNMVERTQDKYYDSALYPVSPWSPQDGYSLDPALVHAVIRQESRFDQNAKSHSGALGLMQIMPKTAQYVAGNTGYRGGLDEYKLRLPEVNMKIGQDYLNYLLEGRHVKGDVVSLLVAYNAGPGNLLNWKERMGKNDDPLFFIEMLPVEETRTYVERVLSNYWIYRMRAGQDVPSLAALSSGKPPQYAYVLTAEYPYKLAANQ